MRLTVLVGVAVVGLSMPAFASTGEFGQRAPAAGQIVPVQVQLATSVYDELGIAHEIFRRLNLPEGDRALYEGEYRGERAEDLVDLEEEYTEENFKCRFLAVIGAPTICVMIID